MQIKNWHVSLTAMLAAGGALMFLSGGWAALGVGALISILITSLGHLLYVSLDQEQKTILTIGSKKHKLED
ncbi:MAG: hypothetical protein ACXABY_16520 [Candidatus Thorarchaeota archaeon]